MKAGEERRGVGKRREERQKYTRDPMGKCFVNLGMF